MKWLRVSSEPLTVDTDLDLGVCLFGITCDYSKESLITWNWISGFPCHSFSQMSIILTSNLRVTYISYLSSKRKLLREIKQKFDNLAIAVLVWMQCCVFPSMGNVGEICPDRSCRKLKIHTKIHISLSTTHDISVDKSHFLLKILRYDLLLRSIRPVLLFRIIEVCHPRDRFT